MSTDVRADSGYRMVRRQQRILFACAALLALLAAGCSVYFFAQYASSSDLERNGVAAVAVVDSAEPERVTVHFETTSGTQTATIDRLGATLCPSTGPLKRYRGCADIPVGLTFDLVYDRDDPAHAMTAEAVDSGSWMQSAIGAVVIALLLIPLAVGRWRWLRQLHGLRSGAAPRTSATVLDIRRSKARKDARGNPAPGLVKLRVAAPDDAAPVGISVFGLASGSDGLAAGSTATFIGAVEPGRAVAVESPGGTLWPNRKSRRVRA